jgi:uncharacterized protein
MTGSPIIRQDLGHRGRYVQMLDGEEAELTFVRVGAEQIIIDHTEVPPRFRGRGIGEALVAHAAGEARRHGWKVRPLCSFAAAQFRGHPEWADVLAR